jgi:hypothetical protein
MLDLTNKKWPSSPLKQKNLDTEQLKQLLRIRADYEKSAFVTEGHLEVRALGAKEFTKPIPPDENSITALVHHTNGHIYGATSGRNAHLFFYNPAPDADAVADIGIVAPEAAIPALALLPDGCLFGVANKADGSAALFIYRSCDVLLQEKDFSGLGVREIFDLPAEDQLFFSTIDPCHSAGEIELITEPQLPEPMTDVIAVGERIYLLGAKSGTLYRYHDKEQQLKKVGRLDVNGNFSPRLIADAEGNVYGAGLYGQLFRCQTDTDRLEKLNIQAPSLKGRELYNQVTAWTCNSGNSIIYGGTIDGIIFQFIPEENRTVCLGKPTDLTRVNALTAAGDKVYALIGERGDCAHLTCYCDRSRELRDLGCLLARSERPWNGYEFSSMITGKDGIIFMGENDRISHLFMYFPPIK